eukprot:TRINITY_DN1676_c0_g1_i7.p1 TRINITY_DN1676_c0_g1~~TRINITY_DN1676_c0_g1_i7.p1  ORF type:complete len:412 (-),score=82.63 TRINITY_DN1676_c0_g1_i7:358-1593(-)
MAEEDNILGHIHLDDFRAYVHLALAYLAAALRFVFHPLQQHVAPLLPWPLCALFWAPRPGSKGVDKRWLESVLRSSVPLPRGNSLKSAHVEDLSGNRGFVGATTRVVVTYTKADDTLPTSFILKTSHGDVASRVNVMKTGMYREAMFYGSRFINWVEKIVPKIHYTFASPALGEFVIVMEDVSKREGATPTNFIMGNQCWGIPKAVEPPRAPALALRGMFLEAAEQHAAHWNSSALYKDAPFFKYADLFNGSGRGRWEGAVRLGHLYWTRAKTEVEAGNKDVRLNPKVVKVVDTAFENASWSRMQAFIGKMKAKEIPFTLTHGDFHASNTFAINPKSGSPKQLEILFFDWSEVGPWEGTADLAQTVISDTPRKIFKTEIEGLVREYWKRLGEHGIDLKEYTWEFCWGRFRM